MLVIEDDEIIVASLKKLLPSDWSMTTRTQLEADVRRTFFHCILIDLHLTKDSATPDGLNVISEAAKTFPRSEIYAMSGKDSLELMEQSLDLGAKGFLAKPINPEKLNRVLGRCESLYALRNLEFSSSELQVRWIGTSPQSQRVIELIAANKGSLEPVLIMGETGTGKEVVAKLLNQQERSRPFVAVNVAAIPENLFESELFGSMKGAFTGADSNRPGLVEAANNGDLFLDEIEALPAALQPKLLRFLESGEFRRVGGRDVLKSSVRLIAASNEDLNESVTKGKFRQDLLFRINGSLIPLPALRNRLEDLGPLAEHFLQTCRPRLGKHFHPKAIDELKLHAWQGNVRELRRVIEQLNLHSPLPIIRASDVSIALQRTGLSQPMGGSLMKDRLALGLDQLVAEFEAGVIRTALTDAGSVEAAAELLKVSRSNLYKKIKEYSIS